MFLYHGTSAKILDTVISQGLRPRGRCKKGNWGHSIPSNPDTVYLTSTWPIHFGKNALRSESDQQLLIVEIDIKVLDADLLVPDEDFLEQATRSDDEFKGAGRTMVERTRWFRERAHTHFQHHWPDSVGGLGTCGYRGEIPVDAIRRVAVLARDHAIAQSSDPTIAIVNHKIMGPFYRNAVRRVFGDSDYEDEPFENGPPWAEVSREGVLVWHWPFIGPMLGDADIGGTLESILPVK